MTGCLSDVIHGAAQQDQGRGGRGTATTAMTRRPGTDGVVSCTGKPPAPNGSARFSTWPR